MGPSTSTTSSGPIQGTTAALTREPGTAEAGRDLSLRPGHIDGDHRPREGWSGHQTRLSFLFLCLRPHLVVPRVNSWQGSGELLGSRGQT